MQGGCAGGRGGGEVNLPAARGPCRSPRRRDGGWVGTARPEGLGARVTPAVAHARSSLAQQGSSLWTSPTAPPHPAWTPGSPAELRAFWGPDGALRGGRGVSEGCGEDSQVHGRRPPAPARRSPSLKPLQPLPPPLRTPEDQPPSPGARLGSSRLHSPDISGGRSGWHPHRGSPLHSTQATGTEQNKNQIKGDKWRRAGQRLVPPR